MQQNPAPSILPTILIGLTAVASFFGIPLTYLLTRRKQKADTLQSDALTRKADAEVRQIDSQIILEAQKRLRELEGIIRTQNVEAGAQERKIADLEWNRRELPLLESQLRTAKALLTLHNIPWDESA